MKSIWIVFLLSFLFFVFSLIALHQSLMLVTVVGNSMLPTLRAGEQVLIFRYWPSKWLCKGQIVIIKNVAVFEKPPNFGITKDLAPIPFLIKRISHMPGDPFFNINSEGGDLNLRQSIIFEKLQATQGKIPDTYVFVSSDNPDYITKNWGLIPFNKIVGVVIKKWSDDRFLGSNNFRN